MKDYIFFSEIDFIDDEYFCEWVNRPSEKSQVFWEEFIRKNPDKSKRIEIAKLIIKSMVPVETGLSKEEIDSLWTKIRRSTIDRRKRNWRLFYPLAAAGILILLASIWWINSESHKNYEVVDYSQLLSAHTAKQDVELIMADKTKLKISEIESELKYIANGQLVINSDKFIQQEAVKRNSGKELLNTIIVPRGNRANITFTDGTKLWLNSGSRAIYPVEFSDLKREIYIQGEGYLEVTHDESRPFTVKTDQMDIKVLGTSFNIIANPEDATTKVILVKGKVIAKPINSTEVILLPNQMISFDKEKQKTVVTEVNVDDYISWKDGLLLCNSEKLESLVRRLEKFYDQKIIFSDESAKFFCLSGKLELKDNFDEVLQVIATTAPVKIKTENNTIYISSNKLKW
ncbi:MAG: FecR domain-containing protein [Bacteroidia bacterium]|nr:FecR domain-containing protein [Bacteroidia bacterium]